MRSEFIGERPKKSCGEVAVLKGHGFSRAADVLNANAALAAEGMLVVQNRFPQGLKPNHLFTYSATWLKPRPFKAEESLADRSFSAVKERRCGR
jgi:hypothetical protein